MISGMPRRKPGTLLPLEHDIVRAALSMERDGTRQFHGFGLAQVIGDGGATRLVAHGTLYKALGRLEAMGLLVSRWEEDPPHGRPRRRLYELTGRGVDAALAAAAASGPSGSAVHPRLSPGTA